MEDQEEARACDGCADLYSMAVLKEKKKQFKPTASSRTSQMTVSTLGMMEHDVRFWCWTMGDEDVKGKLALLPS
jgi:hypothetical protein